MFGKGQVIGINTPALFRQATAGQQVEIINARGLGIDLNKLGSDGVLLPPDLRLEVVDVKDGVVEGEGRGAAHSERVESRCSVSQAHNRSFSSRTVFATAVKRQLGCLGEGWACNRAGGRAAFLYCV